MKVAIKKDWIYLDTDETTAKKLGAVWIASKNAWRIPYTLGAMRELVRIGYDEPIFNAHYQRQCTYHNDMIAMKTTENPNFRLPETLRPYQREDSSFLSQLPHAGVFNEQRTGKTPTVLKTLVIENWDKVIVVCPTSLGLNWAKEIERWTDYAPFLAKGTPTKREKIYEQFQAQNKAMLILSYELVKRDYHKIDLPDNFALVVDEAHILRNRSAQTKWIRILGLNATKRYALTGTPTMNKGQDIFGILSFLYPERFRSYLQFVERYFNTYSNPFGGLEIYSDNPYKRKKELKEIIALVSVQRKRSEVMNWIPAKQYQTIPLEMDAKQTKAYNSMLNDFIVEDGETLVDASGVLAQLTRLRQISLDPQLLNLEALSVKTAFIKEWIDNNSETSVVIFSCFSSYLKKLHEDIKGSGLIIGETSIEDRQTCVEDFQSGKINVLFANVIAAGVGLTLDKAEVVMFTERHFNPAINAQAEDRIIPTTKESNQTCLVIDLVCSSLDEKIKAMLDNKVNITSVINDYKTLKGFLQFEL